MTHVSVIRHVEEHPLCTNWTMNTATTPAIIIGNGPSRKKYTEEQFKEWGVTYGCNTLRHTFSPDFLVASDPWQQQQIIEEGYTLKYNCIFKDWEPIPSGIHWSELSMWPSTYNTVTHGSEKGSESWFMWANESDDRLGEHMTAHVVYVPKGSRIENIRSHETGAVKGVRSQGPTGAFAMQAALEKGHKHLIVIGFDALTGELGSSSRQWGKIDEIGHDFMEEWERDYDSLLSFWPEITLEWRNGNGA